MREFVDYRHPHRWLNCRQGLSTYFSIAVKVWKIRGCIPTSPVEESYRSRVFMYIGGWGLSSTRTSFGVARACACMVCMSNEIGMVICEPGLYLLLFCLGKLSLLPSATSHLLSSFIWLYRYMYSCEDCSRLRSSISTGAGMWGCMLAVQNVCQRTRNTCGHSF